MTTLHEIPELNALVAVASLANENVFGGDTTAITVRRDGTIVASYAADAQALPVESPGVQSRYVRETWSWPVREVPRG